MLSLQAVGRKRGDKLRPCESPQHGFTHSAEHLPRSTSFNPHNRLRLTQVNDELFILFPFMMEATATQRG